MPLPPSLPRLLAAAALLDALAFLTAGLLRHATGGAAAIADLAWVVFLVGVPVVLALVLAVLVAPVLRRRRVPSGQR